MRERKEETKNYILKNRRKTNFKDKYEELTECAHIPAWSFDVSEERLKVWKDILFIRYYLHIGRSNEFHVVLKTAFDKERNIVEENYVIERKI